MMPETLHNTLLTFAGVAVNGKVEYTCHVSEGYVIVDLSDRALVDGYYAPVDSNANSVRFYLGFTARGAEYVEAYGGRAVEAFSDVRDLLPLPTAAYRPVEIYNQKGGVVRLRMDGRDRAIPVHRVLRPLCDVGTPYAAE